ncbi:MAG: type I-C CRISPR-associated endonuclease Cas1c [Clostridia bacterium]
MKKLLNTLYITASGRYLSLDGENIVVLENEAEVGRFPLHNFESIVTCGYTGASPALMGACSVRGIAIVFLTPSGRFLARVTGEDRGNVILRKTQYRCSENPDYAVRIARNFLVGKIFNARWVLERASRDYPLRLDAAKLKGISAGLRDSIAAVRQCEDLGKLRGIEGEAAKSYFSVFDDLILQQKSDFFFHERSRRPPLDNVNALLSFVYTLLAGSCMSALESVGLDPYVGFLHRDRPGRASLALDLMEEFRPCLADRFVLSLINKKIINAKDFMRQENGAVLLSAESRKTVLAAWQNKKYETITHPFLEQKLEWGMAPYSQALLLARFLRGDLEAYPPFLWKF